MNDYHSMPENRPLIYDIVDDHFREYLDTIPGLTEIAINKPDEAWLKIYGKWESRDIDFSYEQGVTFANALSDFQNGSSVTEDNPLLSATLPTGERVHAVMTPVTEKGIVAINIRRPSDVFIPHEKFVSDGFYTKLDVGITETKDTDLVSIYKSNDFSRFVTECLRQGKTMIFSGGTGSGKTTFSNAALYFIPHHLRCISIEDTDEAKFRFHKNHIKLYYPADNDESKITAGALLRACYRMNPDRILMTEIRGGEAWDFLKASSSGHEGGLTTIHEKTPEDAILGLVERCYQNPECNNIPFNALLRKVLNNIDVIVSIKYLDDIDKRYASGIYFKDVDKDEMIKKLVG